MRILSALIFFGALNSNGQAPEVPHKIQFAGMTLTIKDDARREIQEDVDALTRSPKYFNLKVERAKTYFPFIEKIFKEERVPDDFKYLVLQESALISDAVSVSNAVGFWQFKDFTALEVGMRVDNEIDERMNLVASTRGAALYLKKSNYQFNNWILALQAYQMGAGGVQRSVGDKYNGARHMDITSETYWYIKKYLAHRVAFEHAVSGEPLLKVISYETKSPKSIAEIAKEVSVDQQLMMEYNKWAKNGNIPGDKSYTVMIPVGEALEGFNQLTFGAPVAKAKTEDVKPIIEPTTKESEFSIINSADVIKAQQGESLAQLASRSNVKLSRFLKYNDIEITHKVVDGSYYFVESKKRKSEKDHHYVAENESLWSISQQYGLQLKQLSKYNNITTADVLKQHSMLWLTAHKPEDEATYNETDVIAEVEPGETFDWFASSSEKVSSGWQNAFEMPQESESPLETKSSSNQDLVINKSHVVNSGETLYSISKQYTVAVTDLLAWNSLKIEDGIKTGQVINLYQIEEKDLSSVPETTFHIVGDNETLYSIARQYSITIKELMDWNEKGDFALTKGEKLIIRQE